MFQRHCRLCHRKNDSCLCSRYVLHEVSPVDGRRELARLLRAAGRGKRALPGCATRAWVGSYGPEQLCSVDNRFADLDMIPGLRTYPVNPKAREPLVRFMTGALISAGCKVIHSTRP